MTGFDQYYANKTAYNVIWKPQFKQALALKSSAFELLFGGAAGGGKSDFLLMDFYAGVNKYKKNWKGILFRQTLSELEELIERADVLYKPLGAKFISTKKKYVFPGGATIKFRYLEHDNDVKKYQGHQYTWVGFDELGNYATDYAWRYMIIRCRSAAGVPCYMRGTANPGGVGHAWIKARFIDGYEPYKTHKTVETNGLLTVSITRAFIPSLLEDNAALMKNDPGYSDRLKLLPSQLYRAMRNGDWDVFAGQVFDEFRRELHVVKPFALEPGLWKKFYAFDWGFSKPFSLGKWAVNKEGRMVRYGEWYGLLDGETDEGIKLGNPKVAAKAWEMALLEGVTDVVADPSMWSKNDEGPSKAEVWEETGFKMIPANNDRQNGLAVCHQYLSTEMEDGKPMLLVFDHNVNFIRTIPVLTPDPSKPEDINTKLEDHIYDEWRYAAMSDFAHHPTNWLQKQNGQWNTKRRGDGWDPFAMSA